ncbi:MAG: diguanylate cyclase [candidate division NC10 bacterium]
MTAAFRDPSRLIFLDRLTQLYNWRFMAQYLKERFGWLAAQKVPLSVILLDLDDFKQVNEAHGRLAGDVVLRQVARLLHEGRRRGGYAVRYAGDEFFVFLEGADGARAMSVAEAIRSRVGAEPIVVPHTASGIPVQASLGVVTFPDEAQTASGLIEKARRALAHAKRLGKNRASLDVGEWLPTDKEALRQLHRPRLQGRERQLDLFKALFEEAPSGRNRFVLLEGEHGTGKSRLLAELPEMVRSAGLRILQGGCLAQTQAVPYSALSPLIQEYFDRSPELVPPITSRLAGPKLAALSTALPFLVPSKGGGEAVSAPERRRQLFHGMLDLLCLISEGTPLVVLLENLDRADEASLEVFLHLLSRDDGRVIVCATAVTGRRGEPEAGPKGRSLSAFLPYFEASARFTRVTLGRLSPIQVGEMAADLLRHPIPARFHQQLFRISAGIPLVVEETLKALITRGVLRQEEGAWNFEQVTPEDFPVSGDEAIARRLENLDPETLEVISEASVIGPDVDLSVLAEVLGQDPGETLDLVERGRHSGVFEPTEPVADAGDIRFSNARLREIVHDGVDPAHRRETHRKAAQVYEQLAGPEPGEVLGPITYHFERSDDTGKAGFYREKLQALRDWLFSPADVGEPGSGEGGKGAGAGVGTGTGRGGGVTGVGGGGEAGTVKVRIAEATQPFDEENLPVAVRFMKTLTLACKNMRVFPEGSQLVREEVAAAGAALLQLLERLDAVTLAEDRGALSANGKAVAGKALGALAQDLLRFFKEHGIRSVTFVSGVIEPEVEETVRMLSGPALRIPPELDRWEKLLTSRGLVHVGIFPAIYLATTRETAEPAGETVLDDESMRLSAEVFRSLAGAVDNLRLYPPENELNVAIQERLERQAEYLLERIPAVTVALADDSIVINGVRANPKWFGLTSPLLHKLLQESGLTSVTLTRGLTGADLQVFLTHLAQPGADDSMSTLMLGQLLEERGITTIQVGSRFYTAARASLTGGGKGGEAGRGEPGGAGSGTGTAGPAGTRDEEDKIYQRVARWLDAPATAPELREEAIPAAVDSWLGSDRKDLANLLLDRLMAGLASPLEGTRQRAASGLNLLLTGANLGTLAWLRDRSLEPLEKALLRETSPRVFQWEVRAAIEALKLMLREGDLARAAGMAEALGRGQVGRPEQRTLLPLATTAVQAMATAGVFEPLLTALKGSDPARRQQAQGVLTALGESAVPFVANIVTREKDAEVRRVAATILRSLPGAALRVLVPQLNPPTSGEVAQRIVSVLDLVAPELGRDFFFLLAHPDVLVRAEFVGVVSRLPRAAAITFLERALGEREAAILAGALECIRGFQATELVDAILRLLKREVPPEVLKAACLCLGQLKNERAVGPLIEVLQRRARFLGIVKGFPETVRAAAARALGELGSPEAQEALRGVLKDASMAVRSTARLALARLKQAR